MMALGALLGEEAVADVPPGVMDLQVAGIADDSRRVAPGDVFLAVAGGASDGHQHVTEAVRAGAVAVLAERPVAGAGVPVLVVDDLKRRRSFLAGRLLGDPSSALVCVGVTGTNGKTSIACFVAQLAGTLGSTAGYMGTIGWGLPGELAPSALTTESAVVIQQRLARLREQGCAWAVLEVSSHALDQHRVDGVRFDYAVFSNLSRDHLDYHGDFRGYGRAKARLFRFPELKAAIINRDDAFGRDLMTELDGALEVITYGEAEDADVHFTNLGFHSGGVRGHLRTPWGESPFELPLYGAFSVANAAAALAVLCHAGHALPDVVRAMAALPPVPGRMEFFPGEPTLVVDYAHTPDALAKMLAALRPHARGALVCVCGCGGDRDRGKRPLMARACCEHADVVWLTSDNPRGEDPQVILRDMLAGVPAGAEVNVLADRGDAIRGAVAAAAPEDLVVIAGKGHENYQEVRGVRLPFDDRAIAAELAHAGPRGEED